jgi:hypothetical protein
MGKGNLCKFAGKGRFFSNPIAKRGAQTVNRLASAKITHNLGHGHVAEGLASSLTREHERIRMSAVR